MKCKVNVCKILEKVGKLMPMPEKEKLFELRIAESLQQAARHRIIQVQLAAGKALKAWKGEASEESPPKSKGLVVFLSLFSLCRKRETLRSWKGLKASKKETKFKAS